MNFRYELILWFTWILKWIPGITGCVIRRNLLPVKCGKNVKIWDGVQIDSPSKLIIGNNVSINRGSIINAGGGIRIGNDVLIGPNVTIYSQNHKFKDPFVKIKDQGYELKPVFIGNNVWIAANVIILPGVVINDNCVIAAGCTVSKTVESNSVVRQNNSVITTSINRLSK
jgi:acetyltransferase-like isoleucine patch superfamily enzyme